MNTEALDHFRLVCKREFQFLVDEFAFKSAANPPNEFENPFQYRLTNGHVTLVVVGINYGANATVGLIDEIGRSVGVGCLAPNWAPFPKVRKKRAEKSQDEQIADGANLLRENGSDVLRGDLGRFREIGDRINRIRQGFRELKCSRSTQSVLIRRSANRDPG